jgi:hypothetical protein
VEKEGLPGKTIVLEVESASTKAKDPRELLKGIQGPRLRAARWFTRK